MGGKSEHSRLRQRLHRGLKVSVLMNVGQVVVVQPGAAQVFFGEVENQRAREVQGCTRSCTHADGVACIGRDHGPVENDVQTGGVEVVFAHDSRLTGTTECMSNRTYDITIFGATGFVGTLTAEYLAQHAPADVRIALAGRNEAKLEKARATIAEETGKSEVLSWPLVVADSSDASSVSTMASSTRVVITTVGPYAKYGKALAHACAEHGTHYVDLCGEVLFMRESIDGNDELAKSTGARIIHACGFDSVPSDIGMFLLHEQAQKLGSPLKEATMLVKMKGGLSGGTIDSMRNQVQVAADDREAARTLMSPYSLSPDHSKEPDLGQQADFGIIKTEDVGAKPGWAGPFMMAGCNTRVVRRSNALQDYAYGSSLKYSEYQLMGTGLKGRATALALAGGMGMAFKLLTVDKLRGVLSRWVPEPGEGPSKEERESGFFRTTHYGLTESGQQVTATVENQGDPGYKSTALMLSEAALTLAGDQDTLPGSGGVLTPATGLGAPYVARLRNAGMTLTAQG